MGLILNGNVSVEKYEKMETPTLQQLSYLMTHSVDSSLSKRSIVFRKFKAGILLLFSDILLICFSLFISLLIRDLLWPGDVNHAKYLPLVPFLLSLFPVAFYLRGLYPGFGIDVIEELKNLTYSITIVFAFLATMSFLVKDAWEYSRLAFLTSWLISLILVPLGRSLVKKIFSSKEWWGVPVIIIGAGKAGENVINSLRKHQQIGLRPIVAVDDDIDRWGYINKIPVIGGLDTIPRLKEQFNIDNAIFAMPNVSRKRQQEIVEKYQKYFSNITIIADLYGLSSLWVSTKDIGGILGLEFKQSLLKRSSIIRKRIFDIVFSIIFGIITLPICLFIAIVIKLDSKGKVFFRQKRMGINHTIFEIIKYRTMHIDAERRLKELLVNNEEFRNEYEVYHKLRDDPRLTKFGKILRKFSLDELPQFWNVIKGEMSLIGPRAYIPAERPEMQGKDEIILKVKPGISGLWQVTDRNQSSFEERLNTDIYYIRNWSMFLDIYILARTIGVVLLGKGAY